MLGVDHRRGFARIVMRIVTGAFENLLLRQPAVHLAPRVRTNRGIGNDTLGRTLFGRSHQRRWIEMQQQDLVEARPLANNLVHGVHRPCQERWPPRGISLGSGVRFVAFDGDQDITLLGPLARRIGPSRITSVAKSNPTTDIAVRKLRLVDRSRSQHPRHSSARAFLCPSSRSCAATRFVRGADLVGAAPRSAPMTAILGAFRPQQSSAASIKLQVDRALAADHCHAGAQQDSRD